MNTCCKNCKHFRFDFNHLNDCQGSCACPVVVEVPKLPVCLLWASEEIEEALDLDGYRERVSETDGVDCACYERHPCFLVQASRAV